MLSLVYRQNKYYVFHSKSLSDDSFKNHAERAWRVVKYENQMGQKMNCYRIEEGDVVKFGRVRFKVKKMVVNE